MSIEKSRSSRPIRSALQRFLATETSGAILLMLGAVLAIAWANSPWSDSYSTLWSVDLGPYDIRHWINDPLMTLFFLVVGLEIKREITDGELRDRRAAALPVLGALGGMVLPAILYAVINAGGEGSAGWGIPMATDIAFAVGVLAFFSRRIPDALKVFLLSLAIADDIGAILVIAVFYSEDLRLVWLAGATACLLFAWAMLRSRVDRVSAWSIIGIALWVCIQQAGIHPTIAGVTLGLVMPSRPAERIGNALHTWTSYLIIPLFALANAGIRIDSGSIGDAFGSPVTLGIVAGLTVGKILGVGGTVWIATRFVSMSLPADSNWRMFWGVSALAGIGFTVSLFISSLAFGENEIANEATIGIMAGSLVAAGIGIVLLASGRRS